MNTRDLLLEIGAEEIPARFLPSALQQLKEKARSLLEEYRLTFEDVLTYASPRRLVLLIKGLQEEQKDLVEKKKGPSKEAAFDEEGNPTRAALGFASKMGLDVKDLKLEATEKGEYLVAMQKIPGKKTKEVLLELLPLLIKSLTFPKNMYWEESRVRFARPIRWLLCLYGKEIIPFTYAGLKAGNTTRGHRFLCPGPVLIESPEQYISSLEKSGVIVDQNRRSRIIEKQVEAAAADRGVRACISPALLEEVTYLAENPHAVLCSFPEDFLELPREVLVTTMQNHQRFFPTEDREGKISSFFVSVSNNSAAPLENIKSGYEKVLKARLADARFFYNEDLKVSLAEKVEKLKDVLYQEELGTVYEKMERLVSLVGLLSEELALPEKEKRCALRAAYLSKADLTTYMVGEFPELQGIMGEEYALKSGEEEGVARAIFEHYLPRSAGDLLPQTIPGALVALADKVDHLAGCFAVGIRPSGSQDPYALRRHCLGILQILLEHDFDLPFSKLVGFALNLLKDRLNIEVPLEELRAEVKEFAWQRLRFFFQEKEMDYDLVDAVLSTPLEVISSLWKRLKFLQEIRQSQQLEETATAYIRVANLAHHANPEKVLERELLREKGEIELYRAYKESEGKMVEALKDGNLSQALEILAGLRKTIDFFFDDVLVMTDDEKIRLNRLALLKQVQELYLIMADFSKIVFPSFS